MGVNGEALQLHVVYKKLFFTTSHARIRIKYYKSRENPYQVLCALRLNEIEGSYDKVIITIVPSYNGRNITHFLPLALLLMLCTRNNTDGNKLVIFSGIASYYGDNYIIYIVYYLSYVVP